jgi:hypothetical protein
MPIKSEDVLWIKDVKSLSYGAVAGRSYRQIIQNLMLFRLFWPFTGSYYFVLPQ